MRLILAIGLALVLVGCAPTVMVRVHCTGLPSFEGRLVSDGHRVKGADDDTFLVRRNDGTLMRLAKDRCRWEEIKP